MRTKNQFRESKMIEIEKIWDRYPNLEPVERLYMVLWELTAKAERTGNYLELPSHNELARRFFGVFLNPRTGQPTYIPAIMWIKRLIAKIRKDNRHPHIRPYTESHVEMDANGIEWIRHYVTFLKGRKAVLYVNTNLDKQLIAIEEIKKANNDLVNTRRVNLELDGYRMELEVKNRQGKGGSSKRRRRRK